MDPSPKLIYDMKISPLDLDILPGTIFRKKVPCKIKKILQDLFLS